MISRTDVFDKRLTTGSTSPGSGSTRLGPFSLLILSAWCGLVAGLLEVGTIVVRKRFFDPNQLYGMSRHFVWLIPVTDLCLFLALGLLGCIVSRAWPRRGPRLFVGVSCAFTLLPVLLVAFPRIYGLAWLVVALGVGSRLVPMLERNARGLRRIVRITFPVAVGILLILAAAPWVGDLIKQSRANSSPMPRPGSPNVVLIVLDTVAAGHLNLHGYERPTSTTLVELAERGIRFDSAQAPSSWTLPSHATLFTGEWLHNLSVGWLHPLDNARPTLAEFLSARGYSTGGFIANTTYCASDSGLGRGFTRYQDYIFPDLAAFRPAVLINRGLVGIQSIVQFLDDRLDFVRLRSYLYEFWRLFFSDRKTAAMVNREFLHWLSGRTQPERPFFAFLNYFDAHSPYRLPPRRLRRFGVAPADVRQRGLIQHWADLDKARLSPRDVAFAADAYDDCIADLDEQLGKLVDELGRRGVLDQTWLIIASDHGESFGEHAGIFCHGMSLYQSELHVPLLIIPPGGSATKQIVKETVSLRDLAATIVDVIGHGGDTPFPGTSLARFWTGVPAAAPLPPAPSGSVLAEVVPGDGLNVDSYGYPQKTWPLGALNDAGWTYIRQEGKVREELFDLGRDANQQRNLAHDPAVRSVLERMRTDLSRSTSGALMPRRFNR